MMLGTASIATRDLLTRSLWSTVAIVGVIGGGLGLRIALDCRSANSLNAESAVMERQLKNSIAPAPALTGGAVQPHGLAILGVLQNAMMLAARKHGCQLIEFKAGTTVAPYTPRYRKDVPDGEWAQMDAHFTLEGRLRDVMEALRCLNDLSVPVELDTVNLSRSSIAKDGSARLNVQVQLRAISQGAAS